MDLLPGQLEMVQPSQQSNPLTTHMKASSTGMAKSEHTNYAQVKMACLCNYGVGLRRVVGGPRMLDRLHITKAKLAINGLLLRDS